MTASNTSAAENAAKTTEEQNGAQSENEKLEKNLKRSEKLVKEYQFFLLRLLILLIVLWVLFFKIVGITTMPTADMYPRVDAGDLVLFYRLDTDVRPQDVIVLEKSTPDSAEEQLFILRVIAVPGDTVDIDDDGFVIVNGNVQIESNIFYQTPRYEDCTEFPLTLGQDECFVLADSRGSGEDSRYFGPVRKDEVRGTVITIVRRNNL